MDFIYGRRDTSKTEARLLKAITAFVFTGLMVTAYEGSDWIGGDICFTAFFGGWATVYIKWKSQ